MASKSIFQPIGDVNLTENYIILFINSDRITLPENDQLQAVRTIHRCY